MKKILSLLLVLVVLTALAACGKAAPEENKEWTRSGYFEDEHGYMLSVTWMDLGDEAGWYAGFMYGPDPIGDSYGGMVKQEGSSLKGELASGGNMIDVVVTISEEGEDGLLLVVENGATCHFKLMELQEAPIGVSINTEGYGFFTALTDGDTYETPDDYSTTSAILSLYEPTTYMLSAKGGEDWVFVKWTKNGEFLSAEPDITVEFDESADFIAVFEFPAEPAVDLGSSELYTEDELKAAVEKIRVQFEEFEGCELFDIRYAGDEANNEENIRWMNDLAPGKGLEANFTQVAEFLSDFHSPVEETGAWNPDTDYLDWQWWLARSEGGDWEILTWGY
ncbi:MAG: hypothetical protein K5771_00975 [Oscillospiraceae bacterium]|nr:hypothetical protein [Oscillospiraceae bacterium]